MLTEYSKIRVQMRLEVSLSFFQSTEIYDVQHAHAAAALNVEIHEAVMRALDKQQ